MAITTTPSAADYQRAGTLFINDDFRCGRNKTPRHGDRVARSAVDQGFQGPVVGQQALERSQHSASLYDTELPKDQFEKSFDQDVVELRMKTLRNSAAALKKLASRGANHSVLNLSQGGSKASAVQDLYGSMRLAWSPMDERYDYANSHDANEKGKKLLSNFAAAKGLDEKKLLSSDPKVYGPERARLQQMLVKEVDGAVDGSNELETAQAGYDAAVKSFEKNHNSVVVAGENDGLLANTLKSDLASGQKLSIKVDADFYNNPLANADTTVVGAVNDKETARAGYSTRSNLPEIYTRGSLAIDRFGTVSEGTSYAAPRVAAAMAKLHQLNPDLSSEQVEKMVLQMTREVKSGEKSLHVLDTPRLEVMYKK
jgi:hypothetical protein